MKSGVISIISLLTIGVSQVRAGTISISSPGTPFLTIRPITSQDFDSIDLGEVIVGPLGSVVSDDFTTVSSQDIGDKKQLVGISLMVQSHFLMREKRLLSFGNLL